MYDNLGEDWEFSLSITFTYGICNLVLLFGEAFIINIILLCLFILLCFALFH